MEEKKNGCYNRKPFKDSLLVQNGYTTLEGVDAVRVPALTEIPFTMSKPCMHDKKKTDPGCYGCSWVN